MTLLAAPVLVSAMALQIWQLHQTSMSDHSSLTSQPITLKPFPQPIIASSQAPTETAAPAAPPKSASKPKSTTTATPTPTSEIAPASACPNQNVLAQYQSVLLCMTNYARKFNGLGLVSINSQLTAAAQAKANDIINCNDFSHTACGHPSNYWIIQKGYTGNCSAENIAQGQQTPGAVFTAWMNSAGHRANILRSSYVHMGVAEQSAGGKPTWVMELGGC